MYSLDNIARIVLTVALLLVAAIIHEVAHRFGPTCAGRHGQRQANPETPPGTSTRWFRRAAIIMAIAGGFVFSHAKPVPYNPTDSEQRRDEVLVLAGPLNLLHCRRGRPDTSMVRGLS